MKITTTTSVTSRQQIEIELPFFRRDHTSPCVKLLGAINENTVVAIFDGGGHSSVSTSTFEGTKREAVDSYMNWEVISEEEFLHVHAEMLKSLSLQPQLV